MPKTNRDLLYTTFERLAGPVQGPLMAAAFERHVVPKRWKNKKLTDVIPDGQFDRLLAIFTAEIAALKRPKPFKVTRRPFGL